MSATDIILQGACVALGGALGGGVRYAMSTRPHGLLAANTAACGLLGIVVALGLGNQLTLLLGVGIAGSLSTWSSLAAHLGAHYKRSITNGISHTLIAVACGLTAFMAGHTVTDWMVSALG
ncbi:camphor resistance protein CrcB [Corynebacterium sp. 13CS0277]|uniref:CrcB family protein n=1 Tax=Corynebacterium sp. 13CS0277 TaxID=2071994 RepID=UPI000D027FB3|nr:CrcB family protein [Corynebacterium sp. 13CS0277]PRQ10335.1 camphor resistance protein CrcB [Corynebacterium sp. 13CS0277]